MTFLGAAHLGFEVAMIAHALALIFLVPATAACLYYLVPSLVALLWTGRGSAGARPEPHTFAILIPAHNEEATLGRALQSVRELDYPPDRFQTFVIADNCSDRTAEIARSMGAACFERMDRERRGKGYAVAHGIEQIARTEPGIILMLDADCRLNPGALRAFDVAFADGAEAVQSAVRFANADAGVIGLVAAVGAAIDARAAEGRHDLGGSAPLRGMGMAFRRSVLERVPWDAFGIVEDAEYDLRLQRAGIRGRYCAGAVVTTSAPDRLADLAGQRRRWRAALRPTRCLESKPLVLLHLAATAAVCAATGTFLGWAAVLVSLTALLYLRARADLGVNRTRLRALLASPFVVARLGWIAIAGGARPYTEWNRTPRRNGDEAVVN
jgi:cellulose synthase/poly-beta-1,6-N-acetylglucosamine synthase-like glycosyltransferase